VRALEVAAVTGRAFSSFAEAWRSYPPGRVRAVGVALERPALAARIRRRVDGMLQLGLLEEVGALVSAGLGGWLTSTQAIGYAEMARHLQGELSLEEAVAGTVRRTNNLARRQLAWFRRDPRIRWVTAGAGGAMDVVHELRAELGAG
jgi:tRNA dimethylallyltransferase